MHAFVIISVTLVWATEIIICIRCDVVICSFLPAFLNYRRNKKIAQTFHMLTTPIFVVGRSC